MLKMVQIELLNLEMYNGCFFTNIRKKRKKDKRKEEFTSVFQNIMDIYLCQCSIRSIKIMNIEILCKT